MTVTDFGVAKDSHPPQLIELTNANGMHITLMDVGATWLSCRLPISKEETREVLLGVNSMDNFYRQAAYMGTTVGRYANRIAGGQFEIEGEAHQAIVNQGGNCLHGGKEGFDKRRWQILEQTDSQVTFGLTSPDGDQGFPGEVVIAVTYTLTADNAVKIEYHATSDKPTPINLTNHAYFNLEGADKGIDIRSHQLQLEAAYYIPTTELGIPLGSFDDVEGTGFDFTVPKAISKDFLVGKQQEQAKGYDHCFVFDENRDVEQPIAKLTASDNSVRMFVATTKPGMQLYTGNWLAGAPNRADGKYLDYEGVALETQFFPDAPNHPEWTQSDSILKVGEDYYHKTVYQFSF